VTSLGRIIRGSGGLLTSQSDWGAISPEYSLPKSPDGIGPFKSRVRQLRLIFDNRRNLYYYNVDWPKRSPLLIATLDTFDSGDHLEVRRIVSDFVGANTPSDHRIYFAVANEEKRSHNEVEEMLETNGDRYELVKPTPRSRHWFSMLLPCSRREANRRILVASTARSGIADYLLRTYFSAWYMESVVPFIVAKRDPTNWGNQLVNLTGPKNQAILHRDVIKESYCIMTTLWDHGIILVSDKVAQPELIERVRRIAAEHTLELSVKGAETTGGLTHEIQRHEPP